LHDIIGNSLVVTIKLLEVAKLYYSNDRNQSLLALNDAMESISSGIVTMKNISEQNKLNLYSGEQLENELNKIFDKIKNVDIKTKLSVKGSYYSLDSGIFDLILKSSLEFVTNSLKHAEAS